MSKNKKNTDSLPKQCELDRINHATEIRRIHAYYTLREHCVLKQQAENAKKERTRLQVISVFLACTYLLIGIALGVVIANVI